MGFLASLDMKEGGIAASAEEGGVSIGMVPRGTSGPGQFPAVDGVRCELFPVEQLLCCGRRARSAQDVS